MSELRELIIAELDLIAGGDGEVNIHADRVSIGEVSKGNGAPVSQAATTRASVIHTPLVSLESTHDE